MIERAVTDALPKVSEGSPVTVELHLHNGKTAALTVRRLPSGGLETDVVLGTETARLEPFLVAVTVGDEAARLQALASVSDPLDMPPSELPTVLDAIAKPTSLADRVRLQKEAFDRDLVRLLDRVRHRLRQEQSLDLVDLSLPEPEAVAQYVRLQNPFRQEPDGWIAEIVTNLTTELGHEIAARRIGGLPFNLPDAFFAGFKAESVDESKITSPAHARVYLKAIHGAAVDDLRRALVAIFLDRLERQAGIMAGLLRKGSRQLRRSASWRRLHSEIAVGLLWVWADRLTASITSADIDLKKMVEIISRTEPADLTSVLREPDEPIWFRDYVLGIEHTPLVGALVAGILPLVVLTELPSDLRSRLLSVIGMEASGVWYPKPTIAFPHSELLEMWIANDPVAAVIASGGVTVLPFTQRDPDAYVLALLQEPVNAQNPFLVTGILADADFSVLSSETLQAVIIYVDKLIDDQAEQSTAPAFRHAQCIRAECLGASGGKSEMIATIDRFAASFAAKHRNHKTGYVLDSARSPAQKDFVQLLEMVIAYARHVRGCRTDKATALAELTACIADRWTGARHGVIEFLDRTTTMLDSTAVAAIWPSLLRLRQG